ncbi:MAG: GntR family transcriptional regulator [Vampirovibrionales bacterium]
MALSRNTSNNRQSADQSGSKTVHRVSAEAKTAESTAPVSKKGAYSTKPQTQLAQRRQILAPVTTHPATTQVDALQTVYKAELTRLTISQLPKPGHDWVMPGRSKDAAVTDYLLQFIETGVAKGTLTENHLLPRKQDIAQLLGVSVGTVQNAIRTIEDAGHVESKQRIGTLIRKATAGQHRLRKLTSKRDRAVNAVRQYLAERAFQVGDALPSARDIAEAIGSAPNTTRLALEYLTHEGVLHSYGTRGNRANWEVKQLSHVEANMDRLTIESDTLIDQVERDLKQRIADEFSVGAKLPSHLTLAEQLKVSIKTVHDAMRRLGQQGIVQSLRGRYGTFVRRKPDTATIDNLASIFVSVDDQEAHVMLYSYEKVERELLGLIQQHQVGDRLPAMGDLAERFAVSSNTIRKALMTLSDKGLVTFARGRFGGTFVSSTGRSKGKRIAYEAS